MWASCKRRAHDRERASPKNKENLVCVLFFYKQATHIRGLKTHQQKNNGNLGPRLSNQPIRHTSNDFTVQVWKGLQKSASVLK